MDTRSGTLHECATDWYKTYGNGEILRLLKEFANVSDTTVARWFVANMWPNGVNDIKLMVFIQLFGYDVEEAKKIDVKLMAVNRAIAFGAISFSDVQKVMRIQPDSAQRVLHGKVGTSSKCIEQLSRYLKMSRERIETSEKMWQEKIQKFLNPAKDPSPVPLPAAPKAPAVAVVDNAQVTTFNVILSMTNSLSDIAQLHIDSGQLSDSQKLNFALAMSHLCKLLGIRSEALTQLLRERQEKTTADLGEFQSLLKIGGR